jgi:hypothetical protein
MEEQKEFLLTDERAFYLIKHFEELDTKGIIHFQNLGYSNEEINLSLNSIGSKFYASFCNNPFDLIQKINNYSAFEFINQKQNSYLFFELNQKDYCKN